MGYYTSGEGELRLGADEADQLKNLNALVLDVATMLYWVLDLRVMIYESTVRREKG